MDIKKLDFAVLHRLLKIPGPGTQDFVPMVPARDVV